MCQRIPQQQGKQFPLLTSVENLRNFRLTSLGGTGLSVSGFIGGGWRVCVCGGGLSFLWKNHREENAVYF